MYPLHRESAGKGIFYTLKWGVSAHIVNGESVGKWVFTHQKRGPLLHPVNGESIFVYPEMG